MPISTYRFIEPKTLASISDLQLIAQTVVDGFMLGVHQSPRLGAGLEFNQYRSYQPGDDLRRVDWKMFARSDRYFVRESEVETSVSVSFVLDCTASMAHEEQGMAKFDYARFLVASLAYLALGQGDAIGLYGLSDAGATRLAPRREHQQLHRFLHELENLRATGGWPDHSSLEDVFIGSQCRQLIVFVSDLYEQHDEIFKTIAELSSLKNEVLLFHLFGRDELSFSYDGRVEFEDLETGDRVQVDPAKTKADYLAALDNRIRTLEQAAHDRHVAYELLALDQPLDLALRNYLTQRTKYL